MNNNEECELFDVGDDVKKMQPHQPVRLFVITNEIPFPPFNGGLIDQWNRYSSLPRQEFKLALATWNINHTEPAAETISSLAKVFESVVICPLPRGLRGILKRLASLHVHSPHVSSRELDEANERRVFAQASAFKPDAIIQDGLYCGLLAQKLANRMGVPLIHRSHNNEHVYMRQQSRASKSLERRAALRLASLHLARFQYETMAKAAWTFDISVDDMEFWRKRGIEKVSWAPPFFPHLAAREVVHDRQSLPTFDVVYLGNLKAPNNQTGILWFLDEVLPILNNALPQRARVLIAGSYCPADFKTRLSQYQGVTIALNPPNAPEIWASGRVLVNPILSGSGMNIKSVEMLHCDAPIVTTPIGVQGFPQSIRKHFNVAESPTAFAANILDGLKTSPQANPDRRKACSVFGQEGVEALAAQIRKVIL